MLTYMFAISTMTNETKLASMQSDDDIIKMHIECGVTTIHMNAFISHIDIIHYAVAVITLLNDNINIS